MITIYDGKRSLNRICLLIDDNSEYLNELDAIVGDGEHGVNLSGAFNKVAQNIDEFSNNNFTDFMRGIGMELISAGGGAGATFYGIAFMAAGKKANKEKEIDAFLLADMFLFALDEISTRGGAKPGDKTMIDSLFPAVNLFHEEIHSGNELKQALQLSADAAKEGALKTKEMIGKKGRSLYSAERAIGTPDPGAVSAYIIFCGIAGIEPELPV